MRGVFWQNLAMAFVRAWFLLAQSASLFCTRRMRDGAEGSRSDVFVGVESLLDRMDIGCGMAVAVRVKLARMVKNHLVMACMTAVLVGLEL